MFSSFFKRKYLFLTVISITTIVLLVSWNINWGKDKTKWIILADGKGYYAYLPAIFIYRDLNYGFFEEMEMKRCTDPKTFYDYRAYHNNKTTNKYFIGTALLQLPFFLVAHAIAQITSLPADGYSPIYPIFIQVGGIFYLALGLYFLGKLLQLNHVRKSFVIIVLFAAAFGTNLFYYTIREVAMSHVYSFALVCMFLWSIKYFSITKKYRFVIIASVLYGMIVLVRPVNGIILFAVPFIIGSKEIFINSIKSITKKPLLLLAGIGIVFLILSVQLIIYKISTGSFIVDTYSEESFHFLKPHIVDFLFSYKKGAFLYTPLLFLSMAGFYFIRKETFRFVSGLLFFFFLVYILSSWWNWWYGGSFSSRVMIEYIPFFMILLAEALNKTSKNFIRIVLYVLIFLLTVVNQIQTYQYRYNIIHYEDMNKQKYWENFLRIDKLL